MTSFHKYVAALVLIGVVLLGGVMGFTIHVDPYAMYEWPISRGSDRPKPAFDVNLRMLKAVKVDRLRPEGLILGSSTAEFGYDPLHPAWQGKKVYNLALSAGNGYEALQFLKFSHSRSPVKQVFLSTDFFAFNSWSGADARGFHHANLDFGILQRLNRFVVTSASYQAVRWAWQAQHSDSPPSYQELGQRPPEYLSYILGRGHRRVFLAKEREYATSGFFPAGPRDRFEFARPGMDTIAIFQETVRFCRAHDIALTVAIPPCHARYWEVIHATGLWDKFERWKRRLVEAVAHETVAGKAPVALWDFSGYNEVTTEEVPPLDDSGPRMHGYWESVHFHRRIGDMVLARVFGRPREAVVPADFGRRLTPESIDRVLDVIREERSAYVRGHPADVAEIEQIAREAGRGPAK